MLTPSIVVLARDLTRAADILKRAAEHRDRVRLTILDGGRVSLSVECSVSSQPHTLITIKEARQFALAETDAEARGGGMSGKVDRPIELPELGHRAPGRDAARDVAATDARVERGGH